MRRRKKFILFILLLFISNFFTNAISILAVADETSSADITNIKFDKDHYEAIIHYTLKNNEDSLLISANDFDSINQKALEKELGPKNIRINTKDRNIEVNLQKNKTGQFKINVLKSDHTILSISDQNKNDLITKELIIEDNLANPPPSSNTEATGSDIPPATEGIDPNITKDTPEEEDLRANEADTAWIRSRNLRISKGPTLKHNDGKITVPFIYFGDYNYAKMNMRIAAAYEQDESGGGRIDSLTAPNFCLVTAPEGTKLEPDSNFSSETTHIFGHNFGDAQMKDGKQGSNGTFVTTDIHNIDTPTDRKHHPSMAGPDKFGTTIGMLRIPQLFYRIDPKTGMEEQKMVFQQRYIKRNRTYGIETSIIQRFDFSGEVFTDINYKNIGDVEFDDFIGFAFHDLTLTKDYGQIKNEKGINIGDYAPMRSLGNNRGFYMQSDNVESRINFHMDLENSPSAWATRTITKSHHEFKGFTNAGGGLSIVFGTILQAKFTGNPWKHSMHDQYHDKRYKPGSVPEKMFNAFYYDSDPGDKGFDPGAGKRLGKLHKKKESDKTKYISENEPLWDSGITMHTEHQTLEVGDSVKLSYSRTVDLNRENFAPVNYLDQRDTDDNPDIINNDTSEYKLSGAWYDFDSNDVDLYVSFDNDNFESAKQIESYNQKDEEKVAGVPHDWETNLDLTDKDPGKHRVYIWFKDKEGNVSIVDKTVIYLPQKATEAPQIKIINPESTETTPFIPNTEIFKVDGIWNDKDSKTIKSIKYSLDNEKELFINTNLKNPGNNNNVKWELSKFNMSKIGDTRIHKLKVTIEDAEKHQGSDILYFKRSPGAFEIVAPEYIDFGQQILAGEDSPHLHPKFDQKVEVNDYRQKTSVPLKVFVKMSEFESVDSKNLKVPHSVYLDDQLKSNDVFLGETQSPNDDNNMTCTDFTKKVKEGICIVFRCDGNAKTGSFTSEWTWIAQDVP
ncbi:hypothetical protein [Companilactobacillus nodensis]|uniref:hypothetical protein n=1 Tax=Companilactobacillus nodensis TaxID=460870 RepID=UPI000704EAEA|nr:hypothetical protein [Companilactobacillus nodensis]